MSEYNPIFPITPESNQTDISLNINHSGVVPASVASPDQAIRISTDQKEVDMNLNVIRSGTIAIDFDGIGKCKVLYNTKEYWNSQPQLIAKKGYIYIYSNYKKFEDTWIAGMKVGDGRSYLADMAFLDDIYAKHIEDRIIHISQQDREFWNNKVRCYMEDEVVGENLIFTTH